MGFAGDHPDAAVCLTPADRRTAADRRTRGSNRPLARMVLAHLKAYVNNATTGRHTLESIEALRRENKNLSDEIHDLVSIPIAKFA